MVTYSDSGINRDENERLIGNIFNIISRNNKSINKFGSFSALYDLKDIFNKYKRPIMSMSTDGVGTKLLIANMMSLYDYIGIDLVAMVVNDIITSGALPYFITDYISCTKIDQNILTKIISSIQKGCEESNALLVGGETAEHPDNNTNYNIHDMSCTCVGFVDYNNIVSMDNVSDGDVIIGLPSNGLHSNGYSLARHILLNKWSIYDYIDELSLTLGEELIKPTKIYVKDFIEINKLINQNIHGIAHITGGGIVGNLKRIIPDMYSARLSIYDDIIPIVFSLIQSLGDVTREEMYLTFNMGIGLVLIISKNSLSKIQYIIDEKRALVIGDIQKRKNDIILLT